MTRSRLVCRETILLLPGAPPSTPCLFHVEDMGSLPTSLLQTPEALDGQAAHTHSRPQSLPSEPFSGPRSCPVLVWALSTGNQACWSWALPTSRARASTRLTCPGCPWAPLFQTTLRLCAASRTVRSRGQATPGGQAGSADVQAPFRPQARRAAAHREHGLCCGRPGAAQRQEGRCSCCSGQSAFKPRPSGCGQSPEVSGPGEPGGVARGFWGPEKELPVRPVLRGASRALRHLCAPRLLGRGAQCALWLPWQSGYLTAVTSLLGSPGPHRTSPPCLAPVTVPLLLPPAPCITSSSRPSQSPLKRLGWFYH